ncbi:hypothetical protein LPJ61_005932 [Coemansia biformis]|uniref:Uncharacterized protein n=1 Tax=Coemansia biformis TaxID=1286918 RepID=A0A9W7Y1B3_9FUNG|nr:hypothetical protein LPJ61_005932 [Coemansia biformis]
MTHGVNNHMGIAAEVIMIRTKDEDMSIFNDNATMIASGINDILGAEYPGAVSVIPAGTDFNSVHIAHMDGIVARPWNIYAMNMIEYINNDRYTGDYVPPMFTFALDSKSSIVVTHEASGSSSYFTAAI